MQLTKFTDYAIRVLIFAENKKGALITIDEITKAYGISRAHLMKVVNTLTQAGFLKAVRGRGGGIKLAKEPKAINLADVVKVTEPNFAYVECMGDGNCCTITDNCKFKGIMFKARLNFINMLADYSLADIAMQPYSFLEPTD